MKALITPGPLSGVVRAPASKSVAHRMLICAALADAPCSVALEGSNDDIDATLRCLEALGAGVERAAGELRVTPLPRAEDGLRAQPCALLDCGESGSTLRFLLPLAAALGAGARVTGRGRLAQRPLSPLYEQLQAAGAELSEQGSFPLEVRGRAAGGIYRMPGNVSSQYVTGLLLAGPVMGGVCVEVAKPVESRPYLDLTVSAMARFGVEVRVSDEADALRFEVDAQARYRSPGACAVEGDWSAAAFWLCAGALCGTRVGVEGLDLRSAQGDRAVCGALALLGCHVSQADQRATLVPGRLRACTLAMHDVPDLVPPVAAVAACAEGSSQITGVARLRLKESDRLATVSAGLAALGARLSVGDESLRFEGVPSLTGGACDAANDHRIAMMCAIAAARATGPVSIEGAECVRKSYPGFWDDFRALGGVVSFS